MARKIGAFDLRCGEAVLSALLTHPTYGKRKESREGGMDLVRSGNWAFAAYLPVKEARHALGEVWAAIVRKQLPGGLWFKKHGHDLSLRILLGLKHAGMLDAGAAVEPLRHDPLEPFQGLRDVRGLLARRCVFGQVLPQDDCLATRILRDLQQRQQPDGSWHGSVAATSLEVERLLALGLEPGDPSISDAATWLLGQFRESLELERRTPWPVFAKAVFTGSDAGQEWQHAQELMPYMVLTNACFRSVPIIQTALALRVLCRVGLAEHPNVCRAYESLLDMRVKQPVFGLCGDWCAHKCRFLLEDRARARRKIVSKGMHSETKGTGHA